jgi:hypothetical protein
MSDEHEAKDERRKHLYWWNKDYFCIETEGDYVET